MAVRAAGRHDQGVGDGALVLEIDDDDVLGFVLVEAVQDRLFQLGGARLGFFRGNADRRFGRYRRAMRGLAIQRFTPLDAAPST
jgi:hypothetical protein